MNGRQNQQELDHSIREKSTSFSRIRGVENEENWQVELGRAPVHQTDNVQQFNYPHLVKSVFEDKSTYKERIAVIDKNAAEQKKLWKDALDELTEVKWKLFKLEKEKLQDADIKHMQEIDSLKRQLEKQKVSFEETITRMEKECAVKEDVMKKKMRETQEESKKLELRLSEAENMNKNCLQEIDSLKRQLDNQKVSSEEKITQKEKEFAVKMSSMEKETEKLLEERRVLELKILDAEKEKKKMEEKNTQLNKVLQENQKLWQEKLKQTEEKLHAEETARKQVNSMEKERGKEHDEMPFKLSEAEKEKKKWEDKYTEVASKVGKLVKDYKEEKELSKGLQENLRELKVTLHAKEVEVSDLREENADLMRHLETQGAIESAPNETRQELKEGQIIVGKGPSKPPRPKRGRRRK